MRRVVRAVLAVVLGAAWVVALSPAPSEAALLQTSGWWWRAQSGGLPVILPPPPHVPERGLAVGNSVDGAHAVSAVRFELLDGETQPVLTLQVATDAGGEAASLAACHAGSPWFGAEAGQWDAKPTAACDEGSVQGLRSADGATWSFALAPLVVDDGIDVVLVPEAGSPPFDLTFEPVDDDSLETTQSSGDFDDFSPPPGFGSSDGFGGEFDTGSGAFGSFTPPPSAVRPFAPNLTQEEQEVSPDAPVRRRVATVPRAILPAADTTTDPRPLAVLVLAGAVVAGSVLFREPVPAPRLLGPLSGSPARAPATRGPAEVGGLGRFARARTGEPPRLL